MGIQVDDTSVCFARNRNFLEYKSVGCRLWNLSLVSVLVLTLCNILLTVRLLHSECPNHPAAPLPPRPPPVPVHVEPLAPCHPCNLSFPTSMVVDPRLGRWDSARLFKMYDSVLVGDSFVELSLRYKVSIATQSSLEKVHSLVQVAHHWMGPISAALYAAGDHEYRLLQGYINFLRRCYKPVKERVSFHLLFPKDRLPKAQTPAERSEHLDCLQPEGALSELLRQRPAEVVRWRQRNPYPQNHLRNLARKNCQTSYVFLTDIDIIPSTHLAESLDTFLQTAQCAGNCAYVIPTYELDERVRFPKNKTELIRLANKALAQPFHHKVFIYNQFATNFSRWEDDFSEQIHVSHNVTNFEFLYEPFYVAPDIVPPHDERFLGYGFTRNTQVYEMYVAGYQFQVLSPVFTCHWGLQSRKGRPSWREKQNNANRRKFDVFKREVFARYHSDPLHMVQQIADAQPKKVPARVVIPPKH